ADPGIRRVASRILTERAGSCPARVRERRRMQYRAIIHSAACWVALGLAMLPAAARSGPPMRTKAAAVPPAWKDLAGNRYGGAELAARRATVFIFGSTRCPCADGYTSRLVRLAEDYGPRQVRFFLVFSAPGVARKEIEAYTRSRRI